MRMELRTFNYVEDIDFENEVDMVCYEVYINPSQIVSVEPIWNKNGDIFYQVITVNRVYTVVDNMREIRRIIE